MKFKFMFNGIISLSAFMSIFTSCSVVMAANKSGTSIDKVQASRSRGQVLSYGPTIISTEKLSTGELVETYQFKKEKGSAARALMHGALDVCTLGVWEVVGTPVEACMDEEKFFVVKIFYDSKENVIKMELS